MLSSNPAESLSFESIASTRRSEDYFVSQRQRAIRVGQVGLVALIAVAVGTFLAYGGARLSTSQLVTVLFGASGFIAWSMWGTRRIHEYFQHGYRADAAPTRLLGQNGWQVFLHFVGQYTLIVLLYAIAVRVGELRFLWLMLLVPVGHAALFLPAAFAVLACLASSCVLGWSIAEVYGWGSVTGALVQFALAAAFAFVFAQIAASAEKGRAEVALLVGELTDMNRQLRQYSVQAEELAVSRERNELARNIHDSVGHVLTAVNMQLRAAEAMIDRDPASVREAIAKAQKLTLSGLSDIRDSVSTLRASPLQDRPLQVALADLLDDDKSSKLRTLMNIHGAARPLPHAVALAFFRGVQEAVTNVRKHTQATRVEVELDFRAADTVRLSVTDNGGGADTLSGGFGLVGLRERAELLGGKLCVNTVPDGGVQLEMRLPG